ncbi:hypothetical protein [Nocardia carnea]|uniref:hypothetical protein n=1 Tax=Nocardia carnea TaxID=37328 RepID=UPI002455F515|nr:hypothetical protein [Nocardia carnea]
MTTVTASASTAAADGLLRRALRVDGWSTAVFGVLMSAAAVPLRDPLGLPTSLSIPFGMAMLGGGLVLILLAGHPVISARHAAAVVAVNTLSVLGMAGSAASGLLPFTAAGVAFVLVGAVVVAIFAGWEYVGLRRILR